MILGIGTDIESIKRFKESSKKEHFFNLVFSDTEINYCNQKKEPYASFAGKFCGKEAVIKALNKKVSMKDIEITNLESGKIKVLINGKEDKKIKCSISHTKDYAIAFVIILE